ncbi:hypothetical protein JTB14_035049 [Gonioctena quinquepunctata]|nr:hypothetical protein JTB14_035049 [Gonioctena quinquepunctata]
MKIGFGILNRSCNLKRSEAVRENVWRTCFSAKISSGALEWVVGTSSSTQKPLIEFSKETSLEVKNEFDNLGEREMINFAYKYPTEYGVHGSRLAARTLNSTSFQQRAKYQLPEHVDRLGNIKL